MKQILILSVTALKEKLFIAFMLFVFRALDKFELIGQRFEYYVEQFRAAYNHLNAVYLKYDVRQLTKEVQEKDTKRMVAFRKMRDMVRFNVTYPANAEKGEAAQNLMEIIQLYCHSDIAAMKMNERTAVLANMIEDFEEKCQAQVSAIGVGEFLAEMKEAQAEFEVAYENRTSYDAETGLKTMADARKRMTEAYRDLVTAVNLEAKRDAEGELTEFINYLNVEIRRNFINTGQSGTSVGSDSEGEASAVFRTATFKFVGGRSESFPVEVGTVLIAPSNTEGYRWKPEVPELMPASNKTFKEVPIEDREVRLTFHYIDHTEEDLQGVVGSALEAPLNTEGCHWEPAVPSVFPEEDMTFNEVLDEPVSGEGGGESSVPGDSVGGSGSGGSGSEQTWPVINPNDPTVYTGTLHQGSTYRTVSGTVGTPIEIPEPEEGMMWPTNMPSVMPPCDFQAYTMPVDSDVTTLYKLEYKDGDTILRTDYLPAGDIVFLYAAPDGKHWTNTPRYGKMPARDWTVYTQED